MEFKQVQNLGRLGQGQAHLQSKGELQSGNERVGSTSHRSLHAQRCCTCRCAFDPLLPAGLVWILSRLLKQCRMQFIGYCVDNALPKSWGVNHGCSASERFRAFAKPSSALTHLK